MPREPRTARQIPLDLLDAPVNSPPVGFQFGFTRPTSPDAPAQAAHGGAAAGESGQKVLQLGEFDLKLAFARSGTAGENVEDELSTVDDLAVKELFEITLLRAAEFVIEKNDVDVESGYQRLELVELA